MDPDQATQIAFEHQTAGRYADAEKIYREVLQADPAHAGALHLLGLLAHQLGKNDAAVELIERSLRLEPRNPAARNSLGMTLLALKRFEQAEASFRSALELRPDYPEAHNNLANALYALGRAQEAALHYRKTLQLRPEAAVTHNNLGKALTDLGDFEEAAQCFHRALELDPQFAEANNDLGTLFQRRGEIADAVAYFRRALELNARFVEAHGNLANALKQLGHNDAAEKHYRIVAELAPASASAQIHLGTLLHERGLSREARKHFARAVELEPESVAARWALAMGQLTVVPDSQADADACRDSFARELTRLAEWLGAGRSTDGYIGVGTQRPFYLAYQDTNNRALLGQYGQLCARMMELWQRAQGLAMLPPEAGSKIRVGIVSAHVSDHSVWNAIVKSWLTHLDRRRFSFHLFSIDPKRDRETAVAQTLVSSFESGSRSLARWAESILEERLDAILYPEIGMDPMTIQLASMRLAPVQAASWGHPETTGLPTIDYYLSAEYLEPPESQDCYTEQLVKLPNLGICYQPLAVDDAAPDLRGMGIDPDVPLLICPGTPWKYAPSHDRVFAAIARKLGRCQFIFFRDAPDGLWRKLHERLERAFAAEELKFSDFGVFVPWQPRPLFYGLLKRADVYLDTIGFSGFNTAMQAVECAIPIVAYEGRFMRGRLASAILRRMGLHETIAASDEAYVELAVKLATDAEHRANVRAHIRAHRSALNEDFAPIRALEKFLTGAVRQA